MKPLTKFYIKSILRMGFLYGIIMTIFELISGGEFVFWKLLLSSVMFGAMMTLILVPWHISKLRKLGVTEFNDENLAVNQKRTIKAKISKDELIQKLKADPTTKEMRFEETGDIIMLKTGLSSSSFGEKIRIKLKEISGGIKEVDVKSKPKLLFTFLDYGKNKKNVDYIENLIKKTM